MWSSLKVKNPLLIGSYHEGKILWKRSFVLDTKKDFSKLYIGGWAAILKLGSTVI
jgi:hypothetical protein